MTVRELQNAITQLLEDGTISQDDEVLSTRLGYIAGLIPGESRVWLCAEEPTENDQVSGLSDVLSEEEGDG